MAGNIWNTVTDVHTPPFVFVVVPGNAVGDEGATALAGALGQLKELTRLYLPSACVLRWYALAIGSGMQVPLTLFVVGVGVRVCTLVVVCSTLTPHSDPHG